MIVYIIIINNIIHGVYLNKRLAEKCFSDLSHIYDNLYIISKKLIY